jgi:heme exporter protein A
MKNTMLFLENVGVKFGNRELFMSIDSNVQGGELLAVTGRNGAGKSTFLKVIAGLICPAYGKVRLIIEKKEISFEERRNYMGLISPEIILYNTLTGLENIVFLTKLRGITFAAGELDQIFETTGLKGRECDRVGLYSTGMRQRLKLALMLAVNPPLWLLDEPSSNLDDSGRELVNEVIETALKNSAAVVLATNTPEEAKYAKTVIAL